MKRLSWYLALPGVVGIALVMAAVLLLVTMTASKTPTVSAVEGCVLTINKTANEHFVPEGGSIEWTVVVSNTSGFACDDVEVTDVLDTQTTCVSTDPSQGTAPCGTTVDWDVGTIPLHSSATLIIDVNLKGTVEDGATIHNQATVTAELTDDTPDIDIDSNVVSVVVVKPGCNLSIEKVADDDTEFAGDDVTFDITVRNEGPEDCIDPVITDDFDTDQLDCQDTDILHDAGLDCDVSGCSSDDVVWNCDGRMQPGDRIEVQLVAETNKDLDEGDDVDNTACTFGEPALNNIAFVTAGTFTAATVSEDDEACDTETVEIEKPEATPPPPVQTPVVIIVPSTPVPPVPAAAPLPTLAAPPTGTGPEGNSTSWALPIGLGLGGLCLIVLSGSALAKKRTR